LVRQIENPFSPLNVLFFKPLVTAFILASLVGVKNIE